MREFKIPKKPYDEYQVYKKNKIEIKEGVTVLVGCNGSGKSTLLKMMKKELEEKNIPFYSYDNYRDGGYIAMDNAIQRSKPDLLGQLMFSSEGEKIIVNMQDVAKNIGEWEKKNSDAEERWILFDAIGSGLSIDNIDELKSFFRLMVNINKGKKEYIVVCTNEYEFCIGNNTFDVQEGKYVKILDYEGYREFILKTRKQKDKFMDIEKEKE
jgi:GTPase SAR1 family protein